jgi:hypothetical protein
MNVKAFSLSLWYAFLLTLFLIQLFLSRAKAISESSHHSALSLRNFATPCPNLAGRRFDWSILFLSRRIIIDGLLIHENLGTVLVTAL